MIMECRAVLFWGVCFFICQLFQGTVSQGCRDGECEDLAQVGGNITYQIVDSYQGVDALDLCLLVSGANSMSGKHIWLQRIVPLLEAHLTANDIGSTATLPNRYCLVLFGGKGRALRAHFLTASNRIFFSSSDFVLARRKLQKKGDVADGYEAVQFTLNNAPFRESSTPSGKVAKALLLVTDMGRTTLASSSNLTRDHILSVLSGHGVALNTAVDASFSVGSSGRTVLGLHEEHTVSTLDSEGSTYNVITSRTVTYSSQQGNTVHDYVTLAMASGGSAWPLSLLSKANLTVLSTFVKAFTTQNHIEKTSTVKVCEECECVQVGRAAGCVRRECVEASDQEMCRCLVNGPPTECLRPSPVSLDDQSSVLNPTPTPMSRPLFINGALDVSVAGDVELSFHSNINRAAYECILVTNSTETPELVSCSSPYFLKSVPPGDHLLLVTGRRRFSVGTRVFGFKVQPTQSPRLTLLSSPKVNRSIHIETLLYGFYGETELHCSLAGAPFYRCGVSELLSAEDLKESNSVFVVVAIDDRGLKAIGSIGVTRPPPAHSGNVMIESVDSEPPDPFGRVRIVFKTAPLGVACICRVDRSSPQLCKGEFLADPLTLNAGDHHLLITCMLGELTDNKQIKLTLRQPPPPPLGPLSCNIDLQTQAMTLLVNFSCDRLFLATCQVSGSPQEPCNIPYGHYFANISSLSRGPYAFILRLEDLLGRTLMKIVPFSVGVSHRRCCPVVSANSSLTPTGHLRVELQLKVAPGNCSLTEGFSYSVFWGDNGSEVGSLDSLTTVIVTHNYKSMGQYLVEARICNAPSTQENTCCSSLNLPLALH